MNTSLSRSVGYFGDNLFHDVIEVQFRLKNAGFPNLAVDGDCGSKTVAAIREYQGQFMSLPDGLIEVDGATIRRLQFGTLSHGIARRDPFAPPVSNTSATGGVRKNINDLSVSPQAEALLKNYESLRLKPYSDKSSLEITQYVKGATIGYGHLIHNPQEFELYRNGISEMKANEIYHADATFFERGVKKIIISELTQNEYDAVLILAFNIGCGDPVKNTGFVSSKVLKILNGISNGNIDDAWLDWNQSGGKISNGLINRRKSELNIFHHGVYAR